MSAGAIIMLLIGVIGLWGGSVVAVITFIRRSRSDR
ncbi:MAG TPA: methionine/alanine import family NSS transporter small subunit [Jiangellaceae bacterium]|nr:methionine/alanine import family NSS transporter small subunit [Jiangellaceae bacterium]